MKSKFITCFAALAAVVACTKVPNPPAVELPDSYVGTFNVANTGGTEHTVNAIEATYKISDDDKTIDINLLAVSFSPKMPLTLDMTIPGISISQPARDNGARDLTGTDIVPIAMGGPFAQYTVTDLVGSITEDKLTIRMKIGGLPATYSGTAEK